MDSGRLLTIAIPAARTTTGTSDVSDIFAEAMAVTLDVTAASGTAPTLNVVLEDAPSSTGPWTTLATFAQKTVAAVEVQRVTSEAFHRYVRTRWTIAGTAPSFTFSVQATLR